MQRRIYCVALYTGMIHDINGFSIRKLQGVDDGADGDVELLTVNVADECGKYLLGAAARQ